MLARFGFGGLLGGPLQEGARPRAFQVVQRVAPRSRVRVVRGRPQVAVLPELSVDPPPPALLGSLAATLVSFIALLGYDLSGLRYVGARPPLRAVLLASFCGFAIGNTVGLGAFSGGAVHWPKGSTELISRTALSQRHVIVDPGIDVMP